jgi:hypothetical protein
MPRHWAAIYDISADTEIMADELICLRTLSCAAGDVSVPGTVIVLHIQSLRTEVSPAVAQNFARRVRARIRHHETIHGLSNIALYITQCWVVHLTNILPICLGRSLDIQGL